MNKLLVIVGVVALLAAATIITVLVSQTMGPELNLLEGIDEEVLDDLLDELADIDPSDELDDIYLGDLEDELNELEEELEE